jgi:hypothetical protein
MGLHEVRSRNIRVTTRCSRNAASESVSRVETRTRQVFTASSVSRLQYVKDRELAFLKLLKNTAVKMIGKRKLFGSDEATVAKFCAMEGSACLWLPMRFHSRSTEIHSKLADH